jgi:regulatory protein
MGFDAPSLKARALRFLAAREHSRVELRRKLAPHAAEPAEIDAVLDELERAGWLSAERYVASVVHRRAARLGTARVKAELQGHGLDPALVADAVRQLRASELERAREVWQRRFGTPPADPAQRAKQMRFLAGRGFAGDVIRRVVQGADELE